MASSRDRSDVADRGAPILFCMPAEVEAEVGSAVCVRLCPRTLVQHEQQKSPDLKQCAPLTVEIQLGCTRACCKLSLRAYSWITPT
jgi:hypothetical protein